MNAENLFTDVIKNIHFDLLSDGLLDYKRSISLVKGQIWVERKEKKKNSIDSRRCFLLVE